MTHGTREKPTVIRIKLRLGLGLKFQFRQNTPDRWKCVCLMVIISRVTLAALAEVSTRLSAVLVLISLSILRRGGTCRLVAAGGLRRVPDRFLADHCDS